MTREYLSSRLLCEVLGNTDNKIFFNTLLEKGEKRTETTYLLFKYQSGEVPLGKIKS